VTKEKAYRISLSQRNRVTLPSK